MSGVAGRGYHRRERSGTDLLRLTFSLQVLPEEEGPELRKEQARAMADVLSWLSSNLAAAPTRVSGHKGG